jgi:hypothetical protein
MDDWYQVAVRDFKQNKGSTLLSRYDGSPSRVVAGVLRGHDWCEWKFHNVPSGFWQAAENRRRYLRWLGKELGFRRPEDWYRIRVENFWDHHGHVVLKVYSSLYDLMREFLPELDWDQVDKHRPIQVEEILAWADAHHAKHGKWPTRRSGEIPGTGQTWPRIHSCLRHGFRGLPAGGSLAKFLEKHRGVRVGRKPAHLSEKQVLAWADAHFAAHGRWPTQKSGPIPGTSETWTAVTSAMHAGGRGFRRGSSLAQLLAKRRGVRNTKSPPPLKEKLILAWALEYFMTTGRWPSEGSGPIAQSPGDTWSAVDQALAKGRRGLPGRSSLAKLLRKRGLK